ncbi:MAG: nucleotidyltransferase [Anaerolineales bacterium]
MATIQLPQDFREFLQLLDSKGVEYLIVGGYAVTYHGYPRATGDLDVWVAVDSGNAERIVEAIREFGFDVPDLSSDLFLEEDRVIRMGEPPVRIEILTNISGVEFRESFESREVADVDGLPIPFIGLEHLKVNKAAAGRYQDLSDLEHLP